MHLRNPDDIACVVVYNGCDVLLALTVACFIHSDFNGIVIAFLWIDVHVLLNT